MEKVQSPIETARAHYSAWLIAELELVTSQSYTIGSRSLTRANLSEVRQQIIFWQNEIAKLESMQKRKGRNRMMRIVPRDL